MKSIIVHDYMIKDLKLKGFELLIYSVINSFSEFGQVCFVKDTTFCEFLGCSRSQFYKARSALIYKGLIVASDSGFIVNSNDRFDDNLKDNLNELIRIAKTPWLD